MRRRLRFALAASGLLALSVSLAARQTAIGAPPAAAERCSALLSLRPGDVPNRTTRITTAALRPATEAQPAPNPVAGPTPALPEHCEVVGQINDRTTANGQRYAINFRLRLPREWNGIEDAASFACEATGGIGVRPQ
jgi:feruloyl esterase